jgi:hypothetical protein
LRDERSQPRLERAAAQSGHSLSAEIWTRVEQSFAQDQPTSDFIQSVARMAAEIERERGAAWHRHAGAFEVFALAIQMWLGALKPKGSTVFDANWPHATIPSDDPYQLASRIVFRLRREPGFTHSAMRKWMEEEHRAEMMGSPRALLDSKPDQPKKRGK